MRLGKHSLGARKNTRRRRSASANPAESLEVRTLLTAVPFAQEVLYATTAMPEADQEFTMQVADWDSDGISDIMLIQRSGTASGQVEVTVYSSAFATFDARNAGHANAWIAKFPVALAATNGDWEFRIDHWGGGTRPDLFAIQKANTTSGFVEVTVFTGESNFATSSSVFQTTLPTSGRDWTFDLGHFDNDGLVDLFAIRRNGDLSTELFVASGAGTSPSTRFSTLLHEGSTALPRTGKHYDFVVTDLGNDGVPDLLAIRKYSTEYGRVEVSVLPGTTSSSGEAPFRWFSSRTTTVLPDSGRDYNFDSTYFNSPFSQPDDGVPDLVSFLKNPGSTPVIRVLSGVPANSNFVYNSVPVPPSALFTTAGQTTTGLTGSFIDSSLRSVSSHDDWRTSQTVVGTRVDNSIDFTTNSLGVRSFVGITGGTDANWDFFSVQWDGVISIPADGVRLRTVSSDGSRMWIDINGDGQFNQTGDEFVNNGWGNGQDITVGPESVQLAKGVYRIRLQFENGTGPNPMRLLWDFSPTIIPASAYFADAGKTTPGITGSYVDSSLRDPAAPLDWRGNPSVQISGTRLDPAVDFPLFSFGSRSDVGITSGSDGQWDNFSVQWDGYITIPANGIRLNLRSDDGSRMWIDANGDGVFSNTSAEFLDNGWGTGQIVTLSEPGAALNRGTYAVRIQYEEGIGQNIAQLLWDYTPIKQATAVISGITGSTEQRPTIVWTSATGAAGYDLWVNNISTNTGAVVRAITTENWYTPAMNLGIGQFGVWVRSIDLDGNVSAWSPQFNFRIDTPVNIAPLQMIQSTARPVISWNPLPGAERYDLWVNNVSTNQSQYVRLTNITGTQWSSSTDLPMGRYRVWVRGIDAAGIPAKWSSAVDFVVASAPVPVAPLLPTFERTPTLTWTALAGASSYDVTVRNRNTGAIAYQINEIVGTSWTVPVDLVDGPWQWWVTATSSDGDQSTAPQKINIYVGGRPTVLTPSGTTSNTQPEFTWTPVIGAATYDLWVNRVDVPASGVIILTELTDTHFTPTTAMAVGTYRVWVRAVSTTGEVSVWSAAVDYSIVNTSANEEHNHPYLTSIGLELLIDNSSEPKVISKPGVPIESSGTWAEPAVDELPVLPLTQGVIKQHNTNEIDRVFGAAENELFRILPVHSHLHEHPGSASYSDRRYR